MRLFSTMMVVGLALVWASVGGAQQIVAGNSVSPDGGEVVAIDFPVSQCTKNVGGRDGSGLCVFTSIGHAARWQNDRGLVDFQQKMKAELGGGWPAKVDKMIDKYAPKTEYLQYEGSDLEVLRKALAGGRMPSVTYDGRDGVFYSGRIAHMVNLVHLSTKWAAIRDNNYVGEQQVLWMTPEQFRERWQGGRAGWAVFLLSPPPPPVPTLRVTPRPVVGSFSSASGCLDQPASPGQWCTWVRGQGDAWYLWREQQLAGAWKDQQFSPFYAPESSWYTGRDTAPTPVGENYRDYGVCTEWLGRYPAERFTSHGKVLNRQESFRLLAVGNKSLPNDQNLLRITVTGPGGKAVADAIALSPEFAPWKARSVLQYYPEGDSHWHLNGLKFPPNGVLLQRPPEIDGTGVVVHQQNTHNLPSLLAALRQVDPLYQPEKAPDASKPALLRTLEDVPPVAWLVAAGLGIAWLVRRKDP